MNINKTGIFIIGVSLGSLVSYLMELSFYDLPWYPVILFLVLIIIVIITCREEDET